MAEEKLKSFEEFWPHYVGEHSRAGTRALHAVGTVAATTLFVAFAASGRWKWLPLALVPGYGAAWVSHFFIEHNRPATFRHPLWSFIADYKMLGLMLTGRMGKESARLRHAEADLK
jgi:hypothetical protein